MTKKFPTAECLTVLKETDNYQVVMDEECDMFAMIDSIPNYFLLNKTTNKLEWASNSAYEAYFYADKMQEYDDLGSAPPTLLPDREVH